MPNVHDISAPAPPPDVKRTGFAAFLLPVLRPGDAGSAALGAADVTLTFTFTHALRIPFGGVESFEIKKGLFWRSVRIRLNNGEKTVSGLSEAEAEALSAGLESALAGWWRAYLEDHRDVFESVLNRAGQFADLKQYMRHSAFRDLADDAPPVVQKLPKKVPEQLPETDAIRRVKAVLSFVHDPEGFRARVNEGFVSREMERSKAFFDSVESKPLTDEQRRAVVIDEDHNLVVAAAGSGKTSVIAAKTAWLIKKGYCSPSKILLLTFAKDAQKEMEQRIHAGLDHAAASQVTVRTFHSLGRSIIGEVEGKAPSLAKEADDVFALSELLKDVVVNLLKDTAFSNVMHTWFQSHFPFHRSRSEFSTLGQYRDYLRTHQIRSLQGDKVKSYEECDIANFLFLNGVPYEYEGKYEHDESTPEHRQYQPDFYLPDADIYIEHFGINASGDTAPFVDRDDYHASMEWKRDTHAKHGTALLETYSYEKTQGNLTSNLAEKLTSRGVKLSPIPSDQFFNTLTEKGRISPFINLLSTFLKHFKSARLSKEDTAARAAGLPSGNLRAEAFLKVFNPIFEEYQNRLSARGEIDFQDMIIKATEYVKTGRYPNPNQYSYILVDEFQDTSPDRIRLLKALLKSAPGAQLFAVGDDWQSIYRFAGSDTAVMREFSKQFGASERMDLSRTFRCADEIAAAATRFVLSNPDQLQKQVSGVKAGKPCISIGRPETGGPDLLTEAFETIERMHPPGARASVLVLGRYNRSKPFNIVSLAKAHPRFDISFMTVHKSKGLEADYVVVLGLCSGGKDAFPSEIQDDPILDMVLSTPEKHQNAEERRLFYVAMTRAKHHVFLLANEGPPSVFVQEILDDDYEVDTLGRKPEDDVPCPVCTEGILVRKPGKKEKSFFYGCSNYPNCTHIQSACPNCQEGLQVETEKGFACRDCGAPGRACPECGGLLVEIPRKNGNGSFFGCSNHSARGCNYTQNIPAPKEKPV